jgi:flagellar basal-body rod modification protein FlgD
MATVTSSNPAQAVYDALNQGSSIGKASATNANSVTEQQNRFLTLLTTQLKNQDPLNPMDNAQVTSQLAQISTVDGIERLNTTLTKLMSGSVDTQAMQAAAMVGHGVIVPGNGLALIEGKSGGGFELDGAADMVKVTIKDSNGLVVQTLDMGAQDAGVQTFTWDGKSESGAQAANGAYTISVEATQGGKKVAAKALELTAVSSINHSSQGVTLNLGNGTLATMADLRQIF